MKTKRQNGNHEVMTEQSTSATSGSEVRGGKREKRASTGPELQAHDQSGIQDHDRGTGRDATGAEAARDRDRDEAYRSPSCAR